MRTPKSFGRLALMFASGAALVATTGLGPAAGVIISGTPDDDVLRGTVNRDQIDGLAGDDDITGLAGHDVLWGRAGVDVLRGGRGYDRFDGGPGDDLMIGSFGRDQFTSQHPGSDQIFAGAQSDSVDVAAGHAVAEGGPHSDTLGVRGTATAELHGGDGDDMLYTDEEGGGVLSGEGGRDHFTAYSDAGALLYGGADLDVFDVYGTVGGVWGGAGDDLILVYEYTGARATGPLVGGAGNDSLFTQNGDADDVRCGPGIDTARIDLSDTVLDCEVIEHRISGGAGDDVLIGTVYNDIMDGFSGDDLLSGRAGDDTLYPDAGEDTVRGGVGDDEIHAANGFDPADADLVFCGDGVDTVYAESADTVAADCENVIYLEQAAPIRR